MSSSLDGYYDELEEIDHQRKVDKAAELGVPFELGCAIANLLSYYRSHRSTYSYEFYANTERYFNELEKFKI